MLPLPADKGHTTERSRNPNGSLSGADRSTARDAAFWDESDVYRRMDFSLRCVLPCSAVAWGHAIARWPPLLLLAGWLLLLLLLCHAS